MLSAGARLRDSSAPVLQGCRLRLEVPAGCLESQLCLDLRAYQRLH